MKRLLIISCLLVTCFPCDSQSTPAKRSSIGVNIGGLIRADIFQLYLSRSFANHWAVEAGVGAGLSHIGRSRNDDESAHYSEMGDLKETEVKTKGTHSGYIVTQYWPGSPHTGGFLCSGCAYETGKPPDMIMGGGYCIRIWKGLSCRISLLVNMIETFSRDQVTGEVLSIGVNYDF